jgi:hypothetical protein
MKLLLENWREYIAQEDSEQAETIEKLLRMEFDQAISLINALKTDESDNHLEDAYEMALGTEYKDSRRERDDRLRDANDAPRGDEKTWEDFYAAEDQREHFTTQWEAMIEYFAEKDKQ